jgi:hypothetical protein
MSAVFGTKVFKGFPPQNGSWWFPSVMVSTSGQSTIATGASGAIDTNGYNILNWLLRQDFFLFFSSAILCRKFRFTGVRFD